MKAEKHHTLDLPNVIEDDLIVDFQDPEYREAYVEELVNTKIATQIKVLREQRDWSQEELGTRSDNMRQERVSVLEDVNYEAWTLSVLRRFARAYDLVVDVEFKEYGEFLKEFDSFGRPRLEKRSFRDDPAFKMASKDNVRSFPGKLAIATGAAHQLPLPFDTEKVAFMKPTRSKPIGTDDIAENKVIELPKAKSATAG